MKQHDILKINYFKADIEQGNPFIVLKPIYVATMLSLWSYGRKILNCMTWHLLRERKYAIVAYC